MCTGEPEGFYQGFAALNLTQLQHPTSYNGTCLGLDAAMESTTNGPYLSMPQNLTALDPAWHTCNAVLWGAFDPPIALHTATALAPDPGKNSPPTPAPGSPVAPPHAPATPTASLADPIQPGTPSSDPKAAPQGPKQESPISQDPVKSLSNIPRPGPQDPDVSKTDLPDPAQPLTNNGGGPATSAALTDPAQEGSVAQGNSKILSAPPSNDPQRVGEVSEGNPGVDPGNGKNARPVTTALDPTNTADQSPGDRAQSLPSIGGHQIQAASGGGIVVSSSTLQPGRQTTIDGTPLSVGKDQIIIASSTIPLAPPSAAPIITLINGKVISAGGQAAMVSGTTVALAANDDALVINGKTSHLPSPPPASMLTVAGQTLTPAPTGFAIGGQSVLPGGPDVTVDGSTFSLVASGSNALIVNGKTTPLASVPTSVFKVGSQTLTAGPTGFAIGTQSVSAGGSAVMVDGTLVSLDSSELVIGTSTVPLESAPQTQDDGLGSLIMYGVGGGAEPTNGSSNVSNVSPFLGRGTNMRMGFGTIVFALTANFAAAMGLLGSL